MMGSGYPHQQPSVVFNGRGTTWEVRIELREVDAKILDFLGL